MTDRFAARVDVCCEEIRALAVVAVLLYLDELPMDNRVREGE
jgi:hypothetical protein